MVCEQGDPDPLVVALRHRGHHCLPPCVANTEFRPRLYKLGSVERKADRSDGKRYKP